MTCSLHTSTSEVVELQQLQEANNVLLPESQKEAQCLLKKLTHTETLTEAFLFTFEKKRRKKQQKKRDGATRIGLMLSGHC
ncbi:Uncharacterized protein DAT39_008030 [Clarias magur]|uniref:Uncharacterized protein n=1 Tax=Clarias magur TaxID=1594786 RepID=A0A8J4XEK5_CLAMG|nr:Uncharacterized protein DAT39_008030 [Clarias magur]